MYNFDKMGLFWRALPENTSSSERPRNERLVKARNIRQFCVNTQTATCLKPSLLAKAKKQRTIYQFITIIYIKHGVQQPQ